MNNKIIDKTDFVQYEEVRRSGITNMFDIRVVMQLTGLSKEQILYIMENYESLMGEYISSSNTKNEKATA